MKNTVSRWVCCLAATIVLAGVMVADAVADGDKDPKKEARRLQAQLSAVQKEKGILTTQVEELKKQLGDIGSKSVALEKKTGGQRKQLTEMTEKYQEADKNLMEMLQLYADTSKNLQRLQTEKEQEQTRLSGDIQVCEKKNGELYQISLGLMEKYQSKGVFSVLLLAEPFTQLERVKVQNVLQEYGDKAEAARIASTKLPVSLPANTVPASAPVSVAPAAATGESSKAAPTDTPDAVSNAAPNGAIAVEAPVRVSNIAPAGDAADAPTPGVGSKVQDVPRP